MYRPITEKEERKIHPREKANVLSILFFTYTLGTFFKALKKDLDENDICEIIPQCQSTSLGDRLEKEWNDELKTPKPSVIKALFKVFGKEYILLGIASVIFKTFFMVIRPIMLGKLLRYFNEENEDVSQQDAYIYSFSIVLITFLSIMFLHWYMFFISRLGLKLRVAVCSLLYRKSLKLSPKAFNTISNGNIVTLMAKDVYAYDTAIMFAHDLWVGVIQVIIMTVLMYVEIGWSAIVGVLLLVLMVFVLVYLGKLIQTTRLKSAAKTDERIRLIQEILTSIKIIKMYVWEKFFSEKTHQQRKEEMKKLRLIYYLKITSYTLGALSTRVSFYLCILIYIHLNHSLTAEKVFVVLACYGALKSVLTVSIPIGIAYIAEAKSSHKRIKRVLIAEERTEIKTLPEVPLPKIQLSKIEVTKNEQKILSIAHLTLDVGYTGVTGTIGCGKSTLLKLILRDVQLDSGNVKVWGTISYASQEPWIFPGSIKDNIIFGEPLDEDRYQTVVKICALRSDLQNMPKGDQTVIIDKGMNLSKGQQSRINLARAVYRNADIYLLDDSLANLDTNVSRYIFNCAIKDFLKDKLVVLVTHQKNFLMEMDTIVVLDRGFIENIVTPKELETIKLQGDMFSDMQEDSKQNTSDCEGDDNYNETTKLMLQSSQGIYHEEKKEGKVDFKMYIQYYRAIGGFITAVLVIILFFLGQASSTYFDIYISKWVNIEKEITSFEMANETSNSTYIELKDASDKSIYYYTFLIILATTLTLAQSFYLFFCTIRGSMKIHKETFTKVIEATMSFFDVHLSGNILNRFSKDISIIDEILPFVIFECIRILLVIIGITYALVTVNAYFIIPAIILGCLLYFFKVLYIPTGRSLQRLENATRSPVVGQINSSLEGLTTIRASKAQEVLRLQFDRYQDVHNSTSFMVMNQQRGFGFFLDFLCSAFVTTVVLTFVFFDRNALPGNVGLAITQVFGLTGLLQWGIRQWANLENFMTSVERLNEYNNLEVEQKSNKSVSGWPAKGRIIFKDVSMKYERSSVPVLKNINFTVQPQEKIAIIGRTGAGKSSIISAIYKLYKIEGSIVIDGVDIKNCKVDQLRSNVSIIPQDPLLFVGTLRENLDPNNEYSDEELWKVLKEVHMKSYISSLDMSIREGGNFSAGQKQLLCLARSILRDNQILILDEATANVDPDTEILIHNTINQKFGHCTILTVAHKLDNVLNMDKVLVLDKGSIVEFDSPSNLLQNEAGIFYSMIKQAGLLSSKIKDE